MPLVKIPDEDIPILKDLATMGDADFNSLLSALGNTGPSLTPSALVEELAKTTTIKPPQLFPLMRAVLGVFDLKGSVADAAKSVAESASAQKKQDFPESLIEPLSNRLQKLLTFDDALGITSKALDVMREHQHTFCNARIMSDIRPVFTNSTKVAAAAVVIHNLQIGYHEPGTRAHKEFYVALDTDDIQKLKQVIARAEEKTGALEAIIKSANLRYLKV
jgi:hypothetical protein